MKHDPHDIIGVCKCVTNFDVYPIKRYIRTIPNVHSNDQAYYRSVLDAINLWNVHLPLAPQRFMVFDK